MLSCDSTVENESSSNMKSDVYSDIRHISNPNGIDIAYSVKSGLKILEEDGLSFKDLNRNGKLDKYEDWRLPAEERAIDLSSKMSEEQIAGLMLYSGHQSVPANENGYLGGTYDGKYFSKSNVDAWALTDQQEIFLEQDNVRHVLVTTVSSSRDAAKWSNNLQQKEDVPFDMDCHIDSEGNIYDFGFGLNWNGVIKDNRTKKYKRNN